ncbi:WD40-repeat-containing domain protein [Cladochytrium replicatum]|nr:WD40-repeat-containing domain protein [Cladochytrium replicatum]
MATFLTTNTNNVVVYSITSGARSALPDWLAKRKKKALRYDDEYRRRVELIQDFEFPEASIRMKYTPDRKFIIASGVYKPQFRVYELAELAMKFDRHTDCENVTFEILSDDWTKSVHLQADRTIEFHSQFGLHYKTRIPKFGRDMMYHAPSCDLVVVGASNEAWLLNLEQGRFMKSLETDLPAINVCGTNPAHQLFGFGGDNGMMSFWHPNTRKSIAALDIPSALSHWPQYTPDAVDAYPEITSLAFANDGLHLTVGTKTGHVLVYDLRSRRPLMINDHQYGLPIKRIAYHNAGYIMSADTKAVKIWNESNGSFLTAVEPPYDINDMCIDGDSGLINLAVEGVQIQTYHIPQLGPAPRWCPFIENLTEEMTATIRADEGGAGATVYSDYKFVTRPELTKLGMEHLIGTNVLRAYMHGYFMDLRLYMKAKAIADPFAYEEYRRRMVARKIDEERKTRISATNKLPKVNRKLAQKMMKVGMNASEPAGDDESSDEDNNQKRKSKKKKKEMGMEVFQDSRFQALFQNAEFQVDEESEEYKLHHPSEGQATSTSNFEAVEDADRDNETDDEMEDAESDKDNDEDSEDDTRDRKTTASKGPRFFEVKTGRQSQVAFAGTERERRAAEEARQSESLPFAKRLEMERGRGRGRGGADKTYAMGNKSITYRPRSEQKSRRSESTSHPRTKRGVGELRLTKVPGDRGFRGRGGGRGRR